MNGPRVQDRRWALLGGVGLILAGSWLLYDAYDRRGRQRPLPVRVLGV